MSFNRTKRINCQQRLKRLDHKLDFAAKQIRKVQNLRLWTAALTIFGFVCSAIWPRLNLAVPVFIVFVLVFPWLVKVTRRWSVYIASLKAWRDFEWRQESRRLGVYRSPNTLDFSQLDAFGVAKDLDLFGSKSLFTQIDETFSLAGASRLTGWMLADPDREAALKRQKLVKELSASRWFLLRFRMANVSSEEARFSSVELMNSLDQFPEPNLGWKLKLLALISGWLFAVACLVWKPEFWTLYVVANVLFVMSMGKLLGQGEGVLHYFSSLAPSFAVLERERAPRAIESLCSTIRSERPARRIRQFEWPLTLLSVESHPLVYLIINFFLPWSATFSFVLMVQVAGVKRKMRECFAELEEIEALASLAVLASDQTSTFAELNSSPTYRGQGLFHPLIERSSNVSNDFAFASGEKLILLTGSNMSGKSTFLRTIGLNQVLANMGAPVFASELITFPFCLRSCIRVSDSVEQGISYFYAEVQRLKRLLDEANSKSSVLYLIDEIFRGTNNRERLIGSESVIKFLVRTPSIGFVTTHDLELTQIAAGNPAVHNYHFRDEAREGRMYFPYELYDGPSPTTNALKIMKQAGLPI